MCLPSQQQTIEPKVKTFFFLNYSKFISMKHSESSEPPLPYSVIAKVISGHFGQSSWTQATSNCRLSKKKMDIFQMNKSDPPGNWKRSFPDIQLGGLCSPYL